MSADDPGQADFDVRMRRLFADLDTAPGFQARVMQRVSARSLAPRTDLRAQFERARAQATRGLARQAWMNAATALGVGAAGIALVWKHGPAVAAWVQDDVADPGNLTIFGCAVLVAGLWPFLQKYLPR
jgi:ferric-dicitrate binding protein FerR (iron transport regulator)